MGKELLGIPANYIIVRLAAVPGYQALTLHGLKQTVAYTIGTASLALAYAAAIALLYMNSSTKAILQRIAPVGRMARTNYIMQTLTGVFTFSLLGLGF